MTRDPMTHFPVHLSFHLDQKSPRGIPEVGLSQAVVGRTPETRRMKVPCYQCPLVKIDANV